MKPEKKTTARMNTIPAMAATQAANLKTQGVRCGAASVDAGAGAVAVEDRVVVVSDVSLMRHMMRGSTIVTAVRYLCKTCERKTPPYLAKSSGLNGLTANWITR
jgi:hypothetical protein